MIRTCVSQTFRTKGQVRSGPFKGSNEFTSNLKNGTIGLSSAIKYVVYGTYGQGQFVNLQCSLCQNLQRS